jgi:hypothetical protein
MHRGPSILGEYFEEGVKRIPSVLVIVEVGAVRLLACV